MRVVKFGCIVILAVLISSIFIANLHVAGAINQENVNSSSIDIEQAVSSSYPILLIYTSPVQSIKKM